MKQSSIGPPAWAQRPAMRFAGVAVAVAGVLLAAYSFPFGSVVGFMLFLAGVAGVVAGITVALRSQRRPTG